jgi:Zn-dependent peptidase ImmA (M78 family)/transcriptional regulator with XRE-family HTH domain
MTLDPTSFYRVLLSSVDDAEVVNAAQQSDLLFVRSVDQLAEDNPSARGRRLTAIEALNAYGRHVLAQVAADGCALLAESATAAGRVLRGRRELLNISPREVARRAGVEPRVLDQAELSGRLPIQAYDAIAQALGLDERFISFRSEPVGNEGIAFRLRTVGDEHPKMTGTAVSAIAEAAWVTLTQVRLEHALGIVPPRTGIEPSSNYGSPGYPAYMHGTFLARHAREMLDLDDGPVPSLRELCEEEVGVPVVQTELGDAIAGVTVQAGERRAIVLNLSGRNRHVYVRRCTLAHELGHVLFDVSERLRDLRVDDYDGLEELPARAPDPVEQRANAFAVELIAPQADALDCYHAATEDPLGEVMDLFGISFTAARYQVWNALDRSVPLENLTTSHREPAQCYEAAEAFTVDYHPIYGIPASRAGRFSAIVLRAAIERIVSWQTAAGYLRCTERDLRDAEPSLRNLFPTVFDRAP